MTDISHVYMTVEIIVDVESYPYFLHMDGGRQAPVLPVLARVLSEVWNLTESCDHDILGRRTTGKEI